MLLLLLVLLFLFLLLLFVLFSLLLLLMFRSLVFFCCWCCGWFCCSFCYCRWCCMHFYTKTINLGFFINHKVRCSVLWRKVKKALSSINRIGIESSILYLGSGMQEKGQLKTTCGIVLWSVFLKIAILN